MKTTLFGEQMRLSPLESVIGSLLARRNHVLSVHDTVDDPASAHLDIEPPETKFYADLPEEAGLATLEGGLVIPLDLTPHKYLFQKTMPRGLFLPDLLYAREEEGRVIVRPLDVKAPTKKVKNMNISAPQIAAWNVQNLAARSPHVARILKEARRHYGGAPLSFEDGSIIGSFPEKPSASFSRYVRDTGAFAPDEMLEIGLDGVRKVERPQGESSHYRLSDEAVRAGIFATFDARMSRINFKEWRSQMENQMRDGTIYPVAFQVIRGFDERGKARLSHQYHPELGILEYTDLRLETLEKRIGELQLLDGSIEFIVDRLKSHLTNEIRLANNRVGRLEQNLLAVQRRLHREKAVTEKHLAGLGNRYAGIIARIDLADAYRPRAFAVNGEFIDDIIEQTESLSRGGQSFAVINEGEARWALATLMLQKRRKEKKRKKGIPLPNLFNENESFIGTYEATRKEQAHSGRIIKRFTAYLNDEAGLDIEGIWQEMRLHQKEPFPLKQESLAELLPKEGKVNELLKRFIKRHNEYLRHEYVEQSRRLWTYEHIKEGLQQLIETTRGNDGFAARAAYHLARSEAFTTREHPVDGRIDTEIAMDYKGFAQEVIGNIAEYRAALSEGAPLPDFLARFIAARRRRAPSREQRYYRLPVLKKHPEGLLEELEREAKRIVTATDAYLAARLRAEQTYAQKNLQSIEHELERQRAVGISRRNRLEDIDWLRQQGETAYETFTEEHSLILRATEGNMWILGARDAELAALQQENEERKGIMAQRRRALERNHAALIKGAPFIAMNGLAREFYIDLESRSGFFYKVSLTPAIRLENEYWRSEKEDTLKKKRF